MKPLDKSTYTGSYCAKLACNLFNGTISLHAYPWLGAYPGRQAANTMDERTQDQIRKGDQEKKGLVIGKFVFPYSLFPIPCLYAKRERFLLHGAPHAPRNHQS